MQHEEKLHWFDFIRGLAALLVLMGHLRALVFVDYQDNVQLSLFGKFFYMITGLGHQAVVIFFVLSGFFIIGSIHEAVNNHKWSPRMYFFNRLSRLWVVLIPALLITLAWDNLGLYLFPEATVYAEIIPTLPGINPIGKLGLWTFLGNVFFVQTINVATYGSSGALWSLANEFWYYMIFPLFYFTFRPYYAAAVRLSLFVVAILLLYFVGWGIATYFLIWLMGGVTYLLLQNKQLNWGHPLFRLAMVLSFLSVLMLIRLNYKPTIFNDFSLGLVTSILLVSLSATRMDLNPLRKVAIGLSDMSYTLYLFHLSFAVGITATFSPMRQPYSSSTLLLYWGLFSLICIYCFLAYFLFERNTSKLKRKVLSGFKTSAPQ
jgi:peptidoglycan/LPS O-acetylase OafA/YrhL